MRFPKELIEFENIKEIQIDDLKLSKSMYFLYDENELVYIGQTIYPPSSRILVHCGNKKFTRAYYVKVDKKEISALEERLISKFKPRYNIMSRVFKLEIDSEKLRNILKKKKMTSPKLAKKSKVPTHVIKYIRWSGRAKPETVDRIAQALGVDPKDLII